MSDPFDGLMRRVADSALCREDKAALLLALGYMKQSAVAALFRDDARLRNQAIREAQKILGEAAKAMQEVQP